MATVKRIILDTNIWINHLINGNFNFIRFIINNPRFTVLYSVPLLIETETVCLRPKFRKWFDDNTTADLIKLIITSCEMIMVETTVTDCRDEKDNFLLALAIDGKADYLVSQDKDLLILDPYNSTRIITYNDFESLTKP